MILQHERLKDAFAEFGWSRIPEIFDAHAEEAAKHNIPYLEFLDKLLQEEIIAKRERFIRMKTRMAHLPYHRSLEQFDFSFQPSIDERRIRDLATLRFVENRENLIFLGPPGTGKTHLAVALALEAIKHRYTVYFITAHDLVEMLQQAYQNQTIKQKMRALTKPNLLIIDEIGYRKMPRISSFRSYRNAMKRAPSS